MYNKKSKASAILVIITAALLIGLMVILPFLLFNLNINTDAGNTDNALGEALGQAVGTFFSILFYLFGCALIYASAITFIIVALIFGIKMLKQQSRKKLISYNVSMLITTCVLLPLLVIGLFLNGGIILQSTLKIFAILYIVVALLAYTASLITQIVTVILLKKSPEENVLPVTDENLLADESEQ